MILRTFWYIHNFLVLRLYIYTLPSNKLIISNPCLSCQTLEQICSPKLCTNTYLGPTSNKSGWINIQIPVKAADTIFQEIPTSGNQVFCLWTRKRT